MSVKSDLLKRVEKIEHEAGALKMRLNRMTFNPGDVRINYKMLEKHIIEILVEQKYLDFELTRLVDDDE